MKAKKYKKYKYVKRRSTLYDQYLADSGCPCDHSNLKDEQMTEDFVSENFTLGMDINILLRQTLQNVIQSVCLDGSGGKNFCFDDAQLMCFAAAVKNNASILSIQIRYVDVSDVSLVPLCEALRDHATLRALEIHGTHAGYWTSKAARELVCCNSNILVVRIDESALTPADADLVNEAVQYNALACPDLTSNPFYLGLLRKLSRLEEREKSFVQKLEPQPWMTSFVGGSDTHLEDTSRAFDLPNSSSADKNNNLENRKKKKSKVWENITKSIIGAEVCPHFLRGACPYGSRCKFYHPQYTGSHSGGVNLSLYESHNHTYGSKSFQMNTEKGNWLDNADALSTAFGMIAGSTEDIEAMRLRSRLRPSQYTLKIHHLDNCRIKNSISPLSSNHCPRTEGKKKNSFLGSFSRLVLTLCGATSCIMVCAVTLSLYA